MRGSTYWTSQEDDELWRLHAGGVSMIRLSVRFKRTRRAIEVRLMMLRKQRKLAEPQASLARQAEHA